MFIANVEAFAGKLSTNRYLGALRDGIILATPLIIIGSVFLIIGNFPVASWITFLQINDITPWLNKVVNGSFGLIGLVASFGITHSLINSWKEDGISAGIIALSSYLILTPDLIGDGLAVAAYPLAYLGSKGIFAAIVVSIFTSWIYHFFISRKILFKMPAGVPPAVARSFSSLIPGFVIIALFAVIQLLLTKTGLGNIHDVLATLLHKPLSFLGGSLPGTIIAIILNSLFWLIGIHPGGTINAVMAPIWLINTDQNRLALTGGDVLPNIITQPFMDNFVWMGGGGSTIGLVICMLLFAKSKQYRTLGSLSALPGIFNINEPVIFGLPIVMNIKMVIPFILSPVVIAIVSWFAMDLGLVHKTIGVSMPWTMPPIISGYFATGGHVSGAVIQVIGIVISTLIYYPFFISADRQQLMTEVQKNA